MHPRSLRAHLDTATVRKRMGVVALAVPANSVQQAHRLGTADATTVAVSRCTGVAALLIVGREAHRVSRRFPRRCEPTYFDKREPTRLLPPSSSIPVSSTIT